MWAHTAPHSPFTCGLSSVAFPWGTGHSRSLVFPWPLSCALSCFNSGILGCAQRPAGWPRLFMHKCEKHLSNSGDNCPLLLLIRTDCHLA